MNPIDLVVSFKAEVLDAGPESTLPGNLSDKWLEILSSQIEDFFQETEGARITEVLMAVLHILVAKSSGREIKVSEDELFEWFEAYQIELGMETVSRYTNIQFTPATIENIFAERDITACFKDREDFIGGNWQS